MNTLKLKSLRVGIGEKQKDVADVLGIHTPSYCDKENGKTPFSTEEIEKLTSHFQLDLNQVDDIFFDGNLAKGLIRQAV